MVFPCAACRVLNFTGHRFFATLRLTSSPTSKVNKSPGWHPSTAHSLASVLRPIILNSPFHNCAADSCEPPIFCHSW